MIRYDARGTGQSSRHGPYDMETGAADLEAMIEHVGGPAVVLSLADGPNYAVRLAAARPDLVAAVLALAAAPIGRASFADETDALVSSPAVVEAFLEMIATDYRGAMRPLLDAANSQMSDDELRTRIDRQVEYVPQDTLVERLRAWADDDPVEQGRALGDRLWLLTSPDTAGPWFPDNEVMDAVLARLLPEARRIIVADGIVSRPELTAEVVRTITAPTRAG